MSSSEAKSTKTEQSLFEEDDEFEEFPIEEWAVVGEESGEKQLWEENWDDDDVEDDFSRQLRAELERVGQLVTQTEPMKS